MPDPKARAVRHLLRRSATAAILITFPWSLAGGVHAQSDAASSQKLCISLLNLGATADAVEVMCKLKTGGSRGVVAQYNQGGCKTILSTDIVRQNMSAAASAVLDKEKAEGRSKFCAESAEFDRGLKNKTWN